MGQGFQLECSTCGYRRTYLYGTGMMIIIPEEFCRTMNYRNRNKVLRLLKRQDLTGCDCNRLLVHCPKCQKIWVKKYMKLSFNDSEGFETRMVCGRCKQPVHVVDEEIVEKTVADSKCPGCGEHSLRIDKIIDWD